MSIRLATVRLPTTGESTPATRAVRVDDAEAVDLGSPDLVAFLGQPDWRDLATGTQGERYPLTGLRYAPLVPRPEKVVCVGLNYRNHILEMGRGLPTYPTLFAKYSRALIGAYDHVVLPAGSEAVDWEAELGIVIGTEVRHADATQAAAAIAGYTVVNDVTARDFQNRTAQWLQGKTFEATTPVGPWLIVNDAADTSAAADFAITCTVDDEVVQDDTTADLVFGPVELVRYISSIITLVPGDLIATGTPGGVGHVRTPPRYLREGSVIVTRIDGVGECRNTCVATER